MKYLPGRKTVYNFLLNVGHLFLKLGGAPLLRCLTRHKPVFLAPFLSRTVADVFCRSHRIPQAIEILEQQIQRLAWTETFQSVHSPKPTSKQITSRDKLHCLVDLQQALRASTARPFLSFGTLLGFARSGDFLVNDSDLDIGVFTNEINCNRAGELLKAAGFNVCLYEGPDWPGHLKCRHPLGVPVDLIFFKPEADKLLTYTRFLGHLIVRKRSSFELIEKEFHGLKVWVPEPTELFLQENYGDWKNEVPFFDFILSSQLTDYSLPIVQYRAKRCFFTILKKGNRRQARFLLDLVVGKLPDDPFWHWAGKTFFPENDK